MAETSRYYLENNTNGGEVLDAINASLKVDDNADAVVDTNIIFRGTVDLQGETRLPSSLSSLEVTNTLIRADDSTSVVNVKQLVKSLSPILVGQTLLTGSQSGTYRLELDLYNTFMVSDTINLASVMPPINVYISNLNGAISVASIRVRFNKNGVEEYKEFTIQREVSSSQYRAVPDQVFTLQFYSEVTMKLVKESDFTLGSISLLDASNVGENDTVKSAIGKLQTQLNTKIRSGTTIPSNSIGQNGDIYIQY